MASIAAMTTINKIQQNKTHVHTQTHRVVYSFWIIDMDINLNSVPNKTPVPKD